MKITGKVVARMQTGGRDYARVGISKTPQKVAALRFFDIEDHGELNIGDKLDIEITRHVDAIEVSLNELYVLGAQTFNPKLEEQLNEAGV